MQWLIDIVKEWIQSQGYLTTGFINRGDPADHDFTKINFTTDGAWHELDLSGIVPEGAKSVAMTLKLGASTINRFANFRRAGQTNSFNISATATQVAGQIIAEDLTIIVDADRKIEYLFSATTYQFIRLTVKGWWL